MTSVPSPPSEPVAYFELLEQWRDAGTLAGLRLSGAGPERAAEQ